MLYSYKFENATYTIEQILHRKEEACKESELISSSYAIHDYEYLLDTLNDIYSCKSRKMSDFMAPFTGDEIVVGIRHDIDHDIITARAMSKLENRLGINATYYILPSPFMGPNYYAYFDYENKCVMRYSALKDIYLEMQNNGSEIGLHFDATRFYLHDINGQEAMLTELAWLRSIGLQIEGIAAHNSAKADGFENFEYFSEFHLGHQSSVIINGHEIKLGQLSAKALSIKYEANYATPTSYSLEEIKEQWKTAKDNEPQTYLWYYLHRNTYCKWGADLTCWAYRGKKWAISDGKALWLPEATMDDVINITKNSFGKRVLWHIHPCYFGSRI